MDQHAGWDVALKETSIFVRQNRKRICRGKCLSGPQLVAEMIGKHAPYALLAEFETGPLATWFHRRWSPGGMHRRKACQGSTRYGAKQDRRQPTPMAKQFGTIAPDSAAPASFEMRATLAP